ncbi:ribonuclease H-like domain-containing protein [Tanacetum coccineum]
MRGRCGWFQVQTPFGTVSGLGVDQLELRYLISLVVQNKYHIYQLDVNNAFLYGELVDDVYMKLHGGYFDKNDKSVCEMHRSLYALNQAPGKWNEKLIETLLRNNYVQSKKNAYSLFTKSEYDVFIMLLVYVDDISITSNKDDEINKFKDNLSSKFMIKDLGMYVLEVNPLWDDQWLWGGHTSIIRLADTEDRMLYDAKCGLGLYGPCRVLTCGPLKDELDQSV